MKLYKGQIVYLKPDGNFWRGKREKTIFEAKVAEVGRKYAFLCLPSEMSSCYEKVDLQEMCESSDLSPNYFVYIHKEDIYEKPEKQTFIKNQLLKLTYKELIIVEQTLNDIFNDRV